ncbi:hypothetical protein vseg_020901 [Gypsophila vaccaria]
MSEAVKEDETTKMTQVANKTTSKVARIVSRKGAPITRTYELRNSRRTVPVKNNEAAMGYEAAMDADTTEGGDIIEGNQTTTGLEIT